MRTTVTLDPDVAVRLERVRRARGIRFKQALNDALRMGLGQLEFPRPSAKPFETEAVDMGPFLVGIDNVAEALEIAEGPGYRVSA